MVPLVEVDSPVFQQAVRQPSRSVHDLDCQEDAAVAEVSENSRFHSLACSDHSSDGPAGGERGSGAHDGCHDTHLCHHGARLVDRPGGFVLLVVVSQACGLNPPEKSLSSCSHMEQTRKYKNIEIEPSNSYLGLGGG